MLLEFSCSNHKSIREKVFFSTLAGTDTIETISGTAEVAPVSALILVKGDGNGSTAVVSAGTLPAWMAYVFTILVAVVIGACSVWSQKKAGKAGRK